MPRTSFRFPLQFLLDHKERLEDEAKQRWTKAKQAVHQAEEEHRRIGQELMDARQMLSKFSTVDAEQLQIRLSYREQLNLLLEQKYQQIRELRKEESKMQEALVEAAKERKAMELLKEQRLDEFKREQNRKEQKFMDELGQRYPLEK
jgi:flagellar FliJ protein